ncbi:MAG: dephospho-CoA kinase [Planctomycetota bacterium]|jgi:dephospho-CoA kinase
MSDQLPVIGIVGGVGSGKTSVADQFVALGCTRIDADAVGHEMLLRPDVKEQVRQRWSDEVFDDAGDVSRAALGRIVFADPDALADLCAIVHPLIRQEMARLIDQARAAGQSPAVVLDAAVLFEAGWQDLCTHTVFVDAPRDERLARVARQRGWDETQLAARENAQIAVDTKAGMCDYVLSNHASDAHLGRAVRKLLPRIVGAGKHPEG